MREAFHKPNPQCKSAAQRSVNPGSIKHIQAKLTIGQPNDRYEQEADRVADKMVNQSPVTQPNVQKKCAACTGEEQPKLQRVEEEEVRAKPISVIQKQEEELQTKATNGTSTASSDVTNQISVSKGNGSPLPPSVKDSMESGIGADFSRVRIHTDSRAHDLSARLNAQAFTVGSDVYFNKGKYSPESHSGKHLLAHELTHTVQQGASVQRMIQKQDNDVWEPKGTDSEGYTFGRPPHHHEPAEGNWAKIQQISKEKCDDTYLESKYLTAECLCANNSPAEIMETILGTQMYFMPIAQEHLRYYMSGKGGIYNENKNLKDLIENDDKVKQLFGNSMGGRINAGVNEGHFMIEQGHYGLQDYRYAFGGIDRVDWMYDPGTKQVMIWFKDPYDFHPYYKDIYKDLGTGDRFTQGPRSTNCIHAAAVELLKSGDEDTGAAIFIMRGEATFDITHFDLNAKPPLKDGSGAFEQFESSGQQASPDAPNEL